jgi:Family of unknown function (DUF6152)
MRLNIESHGALTPRAGFSIVGHASFASSDHLETEVPVRSTRPGVRLVLAGLLLISVPLLAHHSAAAFDTTKEITLKATVTEWHWANPHCILVFDVKDDAGIVTQWAAEVANPASMTRRGWSRGTFKAGDEITVRLQAAKNGQPLGLILAVTFSDGRELDSGEAARMERSRKEADQYRKLGAGSRESNK